MQLMVIGKIILLGDNGSIGGFMTLVNLLQVNISNFYLQIT